MPFRDMSISPCTKRRAPHTVSYECTRSHFGGVFCQVASALSTHTGGTQKVSPCRPLCRHKLSPTLHTFDTFVGVALYKGGQLAFLESLPRTRRNQNPPLPLQACRRWRPTNSCCPNKPERPATAVYKGLCTFFFSNMRHFGNTSRKTTHRAPAASAIFILVASHIRM